MNVQSWALQSQLTAALTELCSAAEPWDVGFLDITLMKEAGTALGVLRPGQRGAGFSNAPGKSIRHTEAF